MSPNPAVRAPPGGVAVLVDRYPVVSETFVVEEAAALARLGATIHIEAIAPGDAPASALPGGAAAVPVWTRAEDRAHRRALDLAWLALRHPVRCVRDLRARERWRREEPPVTLRELAPVARRLARRGDVHLHAHFAAGAALDAQRLAALLGLPHSVTAHAYDIWLHPRNLAEKLSRAAFVSTGCEYNARHLRAIAPSARVFRVVMGVDAGRVRRERPLGTGRRVIAVGRLVEKKGFDVLLHAAALLGAEELEALVLVGDGPERERLEEMAGEGALSGRVRFTGALMPAEVLERMQDADVLAAPCVVARDGDRDSMPVVVKEAMALELLVAASDEVGLPEIVAPPWGRLTPPGDPAALAAALRELLALDAGERARAGAAARRRVIEEANVDREAERLLSLIVAA
jgi:colanic acid/amylovoran biosynthesis glycosyltransferase